MIVCNVRPHLSLRLGAASRLPFLRSVVTPARVQPSCLLSLLLLKTVSERGASARITVTSNGVTRDTGRNLHIAVLFRFLSQSRVSIRVASSVALGSREREREGERQSTFQISKQSFTLENCVEESTNLKPCTPYNPAIPRLRTCPEKRRHVRQKTGAETDTGYSQSPKPGNPKRSTPAEWPPCGLVRGRHRPENTRSLGATCGRLLTHTTPRERNQEERGHCTSPFTSTKRSSRAAQQVKHPSLSLPWLGFSPWPRNFHTPCVQPKN